MFYRLFRNCKVVGRDLFSENEAEQIPQSERISLEKFFGKSMNTHQIFSGLLDKPDLNDNNI